METTGNKHAHLVLRGGSRGPNYDAEHVRAAAALLRKNSLPPHLMIDCSHANSGKDPQRQPLVAANVAEQIATGDRTIVALMVESNLLGGAQDYQARPLVPGRSITDACLGFEETEALLCRLAAAG